MNVSETIFTKGQNCGRILMVIRVLFERKQEEPNEINYEVLSQLEYKSKFGFMDELKKHVRTDEEYAKYKGYIN